MTWPRGSLTATEQRLPTPFSTALGGVTLQRVVLVSGRILLLCLLCRPGQKVCQRQTMDIYCRIQRGDDVMKQWNGTLLGIIKIMSEKGN